MQMLSSMDYFKSEIKKIVESEIDRLTTNLVDGHSVIDISAYKYQVGVIQGLKAALEIVEEAESETNKRLR